MLASVFVANVALARRRRVFISSLETDCKEMKAEVEVLSTKLLDSQQAADNHNERAKELQLRILAAKS